MENEPRKASEVLLEIENLVHVLINIVRTQDLNIKVLSNKINSLLEKQNNTPAPVHTQQSQPFRIEVEDTSGPSNKIEILPESSLLSEDEPKGFRRVSRHESYDNSAFKSPIKFPMQIPKMTEPEITVPKEAINNIVQKIVPKNDFPSATIPIVQRIVDKNGKAVYLADVEILQLDTKNTLSKTRTNGMGKWMASLPIGKYRVIIRKRESLNKEKLEIMQDIVIDGSSSPLELKTVTIK